MEKLSFKDWKKEVKERICIFGGGSKDGKEYADSIMQHAKEYYYDKEIYNKEFSIEKSCQKIMYGYSCVIIPLSKFKKEIEYVS
jgi:hypothetical protein